MKKILVMALALLLAVALAGCAQGDSQTQEVTSLEPEPYAFELEDMYGNLHSLSDYEGKPVYLRIWTSWCGICVQTLDALDMLSAQAEDYTVLTVVMPSFQGEMSREDFTEWFSDLGYENIVVLFDDDAQIKSDFGVRAYPTQILFDAKGHFAYGVPGVLSAEKINSVMKKITEGS